MALAALILLAQDLALGKPAVSRDSGWPGLRKEWLKVFPDCAACGTSRKIEVHHRVPVHVDAAREMDWTNLLTLCRPCHHMVGHLYNWHDFNPHCAEDAAYFRDRFRRSVRLFGGP